MRKHEVRMISMKSRGKHHKTGGRTLRASLDDECEVNIPVERDPFHAQVETLPNSVRSLIKQGWKRVEKNVKNDKLIVALEFFNTQR